MKFKGLLLDIDNTLYNYSDTHKKALEQLILITRNETLINRTVINAAYFQAKKQIHTELSGTASSHNRLLYIQRMLEILGVNSMNLSVKLYHAYWNTFLDEIKLYDGVIHFLQAQQDKKICFLTDLTAHIQHRKIEKLGLYRYANYIVTSEEAGKEKPHPYMFMLALKKMDLKPNEVCMIGDSFKKDILGASHLGIASYWLDKDEHTEMINTDLIVRFSEFDMLKEYIL